MANLIIKPTSGGSLVLQDEGGDAAVTVGTTGSTTLAGTANNLGTVTAGSIAGGAITSATAFPAGHILQVVQGTATASLTLTSTSYVTCGLSATITPALTSNKVLATYCITMDSDAGGTAAQFALYAGGSNIVDKSHYAHGASTRIITSATLSYLHSPSTTSAITYELFAKKNSGTQFLTRYGNTMSTMTLMEIKG